MKIGFEVYDYGRWLALVNYENGTVYAKIGYRTWMKGAARLWDKLWARLRRKPKS